MAECRLFFLDNVSLYHEIHEIIQTSISKGGCVLSSWGGVLRGVPQAIDMERHPSIINNFLQRTRCGAKGRNKGRHNSNTVPSFSKDGLGPCYPHH